MNKNGIIALEATRIINESNEVTPRQAWLKTAKNYSPTSQSSQIKSCPMSTYLGLCEEGLVKGVPAGKYTRSSKNKAYALRAIKLIRQDPNLLDTPKELILAASYGKMQSLNGQIDVISALWKAGLIIDKK